jgi:hypothetical protein
MDEQSFQKHEDLLLAASAVADEEASDMGALVADLERAADALGTAFNRLSRHTDPVLCLVQGRVETAMETIDASIGLVKGMTYDPTP